MKFQHFPGVKIYGCLENKAATTKVSAVILFSAAIGACLGKVNETRSIGITCEKNKGIIKETQRRFIWVKPTLGRLKFHTNNEIVHIEDMTVNISLRGNTHFLKTMLVYLLKDRSLILNKN